MNIITGSLAAAFIINGIDEALVTAALMEAQRLQISLIQYCAQQRLIAAKKLAQITAEYFGLNYVNLASLDIKKLPINTVKLELLKKYGVLPLAQHGNELEIGVVDPTLQKVQEEIKFYSGLNVKSVIVDYDLLAGILEIIFTHYHYAETHKPDAQVVDFIDHVLLDAVNKKASDIHFESYADTYRVRFRIDGILHDITEPSLSLAPRITARLKILGQMDIAERRIPQDGRFSFRNMDCRISACPTIYGEKLVVRLLEANQRTLDVDDLGLETEQKQIFLASINRPQGMVLVTGPTGSGKTLSLYTALHLLNTEDKNISTIEDPVEIRLAGINQLQINTRAGMDFSKALRAFLRQDPDIIMVGEMRDQETAEIAIKAAQTGHLVLSTLHTNSAAESLTRLINMGIAAYNIAGSLSLIIAQRLVRKLCSHCKKAQHLPNSALLELGFDITELEDMALFAPHGCKHCVKGYSGRIGVYELLPITPEINELILARATVNKIVECAIQQNMIPLYRAALNKVKKGITSLSEVQRAIM